MTMSSNFIMPLPEDESALPLSPLQKLAMICRELAHPSPPSEPVNLTALTNQALKEGKVTFFKLPPTPGESG